MSSTTPPTLGMRHVALNVRDPQKSKDFYTRVLGMQVEWEPDPDNVYLTNHGQDNVAIHKATETTTSSTQKLDHIGFIVKTMNDVDAWFAHIKSHGAKIVKDVKTHRDGARSFYFSDPDGIVIQIIYHPPISQNA
jgi:catechol 2,3-dioxygenase-like lactoylglutathione lyase family enzyme